MNVPMLIFRIIITSVVFGIAYANLLHFSDKLAKFIGYLGAMFLFPILVALAVTYLVTRLRNDERRTPKWFYFLNSIVSIVPSVYLFLMLTFAEGL